MKDPFLNLFLGLSFIGVVGYSLNQAGPARTPASISSVQSKPVPVAAPKKPLCAFSPESIQQKRAQETRPAVYVGSGAAFDTDNLEVALRKVADTGGIIRIYGGSHDFPHNVFIFNQVSIIGEPSLKNSLRFSSQILNSDAKIHFENLKLEGQDAPWFIRTHTPKYLSYEAVSFDPIP